MGIVVASLVALIWLLGIARPLADLPPLDANALGGYGTAWNAVRVGKAALYAFSLGWLVAVRAEGDGVWAALSRGFVLGAAVVSVAVLWERGVFGDLTAASTYWEAFSGLLDVTHRYRATAWFSEMHLGGTAFDGYLVLSWPFVLGEAFGPDGKRAWRAAAGGAALGLLYAVAVSFTRTTYAVVAFMSVAFVLASVWSGRFRAGGGALTGWALMAILQGITYSFLFRKGGYLALAGGTFAFVGGEVLVAGGDRFSPRVRQGAGILLLLFSGYVVFHGAWTSRWVENSLLFSLAVASGGALVLVTLGAAFVRVSPRRAWKPATVLGGAGLAVALALASAMLGGYLMSSRFSAAKEDFRTRIGHWEDVLAAMEPDAGARLWGRGLGTFPSRYRTVVQKEPQPAPYVIREEEGNRFLRMRGTQYLLLGQRVRFLPDTEYRFRARVRAGAKKATLPVKIERRNLLLDEYNPHRTRNVVAETTSGTWVWVESTIDTGNFGGWKWWAQWPPMFELGFHRRGAWIEVDDVALIGPDGRNVLRNGSFDRGLEGWFLYSDHDHLPWHVKNLYLNVFFDLGLVGLAGFALLALVALFTCARGMRDSWGCLLGFVSICGFLLLGLTSSPIDAPRVALLFYGLLIVAAVQSGQSWNLPAAPGQV
ncbi:O-antigen ligase family protein [Deferrisoma camini]|uniref:O-antigen ligase family protein n=1 Tax=Deferrisoma camini TaxID=1035120 RepID=UPI00146B6469|nr:hypothetical protein [Deferrisoma camini]